MAKGERIGKVSERKDNSLLSLARPMGQPKLASFAFAMMGFVCPMVVPIIVATFANISTRMAKTALGILQRRNRFQVGRIEASPIPAQMIDIPLCRDRAVSHDVVSPMNNERKRLLVHLLLYQTVALVIRTACPLPTFRVGQSLPHFFGSFSEALKERLDVWVRRIDVFSSLHSFKYTPEVA